jgi:AraC family transcriptional regulator, 4-hydroxyphenylacetate 3-monooxygenase operon regulatory protein
MGRDSHHKADAPAIPDIHIGRVYDPDEPDIDLHYETFERLAEFFGRNTPAHRHQSFYQIHLLTEGCIRLHLDDLFYEGDAPLVFTTPPNVPHAFYTDDTTRGHTLTVHQETVRGWIAAMPGQWPESLLRDKAVVRLAEPLVREDADAHRLIALAAMLRNEYARHERGRSSAVLALGQLFFIGVSRLVLAALPDSRVLRGKGDDLRMFLRFCDLVDARYREHGTLTDYARYLNVTEARLNDICRRISNQSSKELIHDRLFQEARRLLLFSAVPVNEIGYQLGFTDPAYFSRFFSKRANVPPSRFRTQHQSSRRQSQRARAPAR